MHGLRWHPATGPGSLPSWSAARWPSAVATGAASPTPAVRRPLSDRAPSPMDAAMLAPPAVASRSERRSRQTPDPVAVQARPVCLLLPTRRARRLRAALAVVHRIFRQDGLALAGLKELLQPDQALLQLRLDRPKQGVPASALGGVVGSGSNTNSAPQSNTARR